MRKVCRLVALVFALVSGPGRAEGIYTGVEDLLIPLAILVGPFIVVRDLLFGSDDNANASTQKEAGKALEQFKTTLPVSGLYVGPLDLQLALYGLLVESRIPFIEVNSNSIAWLTANAANPAQLQTAATQAKLLRLSLGDRQSPDCFRWKNDDEDFTLHAPVRPGTCLIARHGDTPQSNLRLQVNAAKVGKRRLEWQLVEQSSNRVLFSMPFWQPQTEGKPLQVNVAYRSRHEDSIWVRLLHKLSPLPAPAAGDTHGHPYLVDWYPEIDRPKEARVKGGLVLGDVRLTQLDWSGSNRGSANEAWTNAYQRAYASAKPVVINNKALLVPGTGRVGPACANPLGQQCDFAEHFVTELGVVTTTVREAHASFKAAPFPDVAAQPMAISLSLRDYRGELVWYMGIRPRALPAHAQLCEDFSQNCSFRVKDVRISSSELVLLGSFISTRGGLDQALAGRNFEWVVPRAEIPALQYEK